MNPIDKVVDKDKNYSQVLFEFKNLLKEKTAELVEQTRQATVGEIIENNSNTIKQDTKPLIVIVDELDRCKPTFAIEFLEKLKHLFDIDNMLFILFINEKELASAISHAYGVNGEDYLGKFINFKIELKNKNENLETSKIMSFIERKFNFDNIKVKPVVNGFDKDKNINPIHDLIKTLHVGLNLSFRDIINLHMFCEFISDFIEDEYNFAFLIILKALQITHHEVYGLHVNIENVRVHNSTKVNKFDIELPAFMKYKDIQEQNRYLKVFSLFYDNIYSVMEQNITAHYNEKEQKQHLSSYMNDTSYVRMVMLLEDLVKSSKIFNVQTFHQYIDKLILYINLDIPDIDKI